MHCLSYEFYPETLTSHKEDRLEEGKSYHLALIFMRLLSWTNVLFRRELAKIILKEMRYQRRFNGTIFHQVCPRMQILLKRYEL